LADKEEILKTTKWRGNRLARAYRNLVTRTAAQLRMDDDTNMHLALHIYDLIQYEGITLARSYVDLVKRTHRLDSARYGFRATRAAVRYLHKVMVIKDEVYVAHLLTSVEKHRRDCLRYRIDPKRGDKVIYRHLNRPELNLFGLRIRFRVVTRDWQLNWMKQMKFLRRIPTWHAKEKLFRDWYMGLVERFEYADAVSYDAYVSALELPEEVRGYREVRYPKMNEAMEKASSLIDEVISQKMTHTSDFRAPTQS